jgi:hypothetical protein
MTPEYSIKWIEAGCNVYVHGADVGLFNTCLRNDLDKIRKATGTEAAGASTEPAQAI